MVTFERKDSAELPLSPWQHLVLQPGCWRKQAYLKGKNLWVDCLVSTVRANGWEAAEAAYQLDLPKEAIEEAIAYADQNSDLLRAERKVERDKLSAWAKQNSPPQSWYDEDFSGLY